MGKKVLKRKTGPKVKKQMLTFLVDCTIPVKDKVFRARELEQHFKERIKVKGKTNNLGESVTISVEDDKRVKVVAEAPFVKRYLKYLTKKYLKKQDLRNFLRVIATSRNSYELRYFKVESEEVE